MTRFTPADEIGADDHDAIADRVDRGVAELDFTVESVVMDVREQATGGGQ